MGKAQGGGEAIALFDLRSSRRECFFEAPGSPLAHRARDACRNARARTKGTGKKEGDDGKKERNAEGRGASGGLQRGGTRSVRRSEARRSALGNRPRRLGVCGKTILDALERASRVQRAPDAPLEEARNEMPPPPCPVARPSLSHVPSRPPRPLFFSHASSFPLQAALAYAAASAAQMPTTPAPQ